MTNRLLLFRLLQFSIAICLSSTSFDLNAQCEGTPVSANSCPGGASGQESKGDFFTLRYCGPDTFYVDSFNCFVNFNIPSGNLNISPNFTASALSVGLTGYAQEDPIPAGQEVSVVYIISGNSPPVSDTLCFTLFFADTIAPSINTVISNVTEACDTADYVAWADAQKAILMATSTDNCFVDSVYYTPANFTANCGSQVVTFHVMDEFGNEATTTATYNKTDLVKPVLMNLPASPVTILCTDALPPIAMVTASDNCLSGSIVPSFTENSSKTNDGSCTDNAYTLTRTWSASDGCGDSSSFSQLINVLDTVAPNFVIPADTTVNCNQATDTVALGGITNITDNCSDNNTVSFSQTITNGSCPQERVIMRTWTVKDACMNSRSKTQKITVVDNVPPTATSPPNITVSCYSSINNLTQVGSPTNLNDNCDLTPTATFTDVVTTVITNCEYTVQRSWVVEDDCGNLSPVMVQTIKVKDSTPPVVLNAAANLVISCDDALDVDSVFNAWVVSHGSATASDNCTAANALVWEAYNAGTSNPATLPLPDCMNPVTGIYRTRTVNFIVSDQCGNRDTTTATFTVRDDTPPVISACPADTTVQTDPGVCGATVLFIVPMVTEDCGNTKSTLNLLETEALTYPGGDPVETPVDDVVFEFFVSGPPYTALDSGNLVISLDDVDSEAPTEFFRAYGEDGTLLGTISNTPTQCGDTSTAFVLSAAQLNEWAFDGLIRIVLKPNIPANLPGRFSVNPICANASASASLNYPVLFPNHLRFEYNVNGGPRVAVSPVAPLPVMLEQGVNDIGYFFTDCTGNQDSCSFKVTVEDKESPTILCPPDATYFLDPNECDKQVEVPLFSDVLDNCGVTTPSMQQQPGDSLGALITYSYNPNLNDYVANDKVFIFSGLQGDATPGGVQLIITLQADVDSIGEYFEVYDNDNNLLGTTKSNQVSPGDCNSPATAVFDIPAAVFNDWATAGDIQVTIRSYMGYPIPPAGPGWGINPCDPSMVNNDGDSDGSYVYATFVYESVEPMFYASGATQIDTVTLNPPLEASTYTLNQGVTTFTYQVDDLAGNTGICSFNIEVVDNIPPVALCGPTFVDINPSGIVVDTIFPSEIDLGSSDNCPNFTMEVIPNIVTCNSGFFTPVTLLVTDAAGNTSFCNTFVNVTVMAPEPSVTSACGSGTLQFFANPPLVPGSGTAPYQYVWYNQQGVPFAYEKNPVILNANQSNLGFYLVSIQGLTGCVSTASVQVTCDQLPLSKPVATANDNQICSSEQVVLTTASVCGSTVKYKWHQGAAPTGILLGTTTVPTFSFQPSGAGNFNYYVVVERAGCDSEASDPVSVQVILTPVATPSQANISLCEGDEILLNSIGNLPGSTCSWQGPCGYSSTSCNPAPILNTTACNSGTYELVVSRSGCASEPATVAVSVLPKLATPQLLNSTSAAIPACEGSQITLTASQVSGAVSYLWTSPVFTTIPTMNNILVIPNADINLHAGAWTVQAIGPCESNVSQPTTVHLVPKPAAVTAAVTPSQVCEGQNAQLSSSSATPNVNYLWTFPNGQTAAQQNLLLSGVGDASDGIYTLTVSTQFGCSTQTTVELDVANRVEITGISSNAPTCVSGPVNVQLVATMFPPDDGTYVYTWTGPNYGSSDSFAIIPNATFANSGAYTLVVTNALGCSSLPSTVNVGVPQVLPTPSTPVLSVPNPYCEGDEVIMTTNAYPGAASYVWTGPSNSYSTSTPSLMLSDLTAAEAGNYTVYFVVSDCNSATSGSVELMVNPAPIIAPTSNSPVCEGETIALGLNCSTGALYEWTGPGGFTASVCNPVVPGANPLLNAGTYTVRKNENGCWSDAIAVNVEVKPKPSVPTAVNAGPYCADTETVILSVTSNSATPGAAYTWYNLNNEPLGNAVLNLNFPLSNPQQYGNGSFEFYVVATLNGCASVASIPTQVTLNTIPSNLAEAGPDDTVCAEDIISLQATTPSAGTGIWTLVSGSPSGVSIANPDSPFSTVDGLQGGTVYTFQWSLSNGACENYSTDQVELAVTAPEEANAGEPITACFSAIANLNAAPASNGVGSWSQPAPQASLGVGIVDPSNPATQVTGLVAGNSYVFTWTIETGCGTSSAAVVVTASDENAFAGFDLAVCGAEGDAQLDATGALSGVGTWTTEDTSVVIVTPSDPKTIVRDLKPGENILVWTINEASCGHYSIDSVVVFFEEVGAVDDVVEVPYAGTLTVDVSANDLINGLFEVNIIDEPEHGRLTVGPDGVLIYEAGLTYIGPDAAIYEICQQDCDCVYASVYFNVGNNANCFAPSIITPNNDGINDAFVVPCLTDLISFPNNAVSIYNQWGDGVFYAKPYRNDWMGTHDGEELPTGTYFYIVDLGKGDKPMSGYLIIQR
jgi:gliding motility-associated-like protein